MLPFLVLVISMETMDVAISDNCNNLLRIFILGLVNAGLVPCHDDNIVHILMVIKLYILSTS